MTKLKKERTYPPILPLRFFRWFCHPKLRDSIEGDLMELYEERKVKSGKLKADVRFILDVVLLFRPSIIKPVEGYQNLNNYGMVKSYVKVGWRNLLRNKSYSAINIGGLAVGMAVTILIGLWIWNELSFNKSFKNYNRVGQLWQFVSFDVEKSSYNSLPIPLASELRDQYPDFERVSLSSYTKDGTLAIHNKQLVRQGNYVEPDFIDMMSVKMLSGSRNDMQDINTIMLSNTLAFDLFDDVEPLNKIITLNENFSVKVIGVYEDFPDNSAFKEVSFLAPWALYESQDRWVKNSAHVWDENSWQIFAQLKEGKDFEEVSAKIKDIRMKLDNPPGYKPEFFVHPMSKWHLYGEFKNGVNAGGQITYVWLFGLIGIFVLLLACINFMNLATARSEKRAREVGIRKSIGSVRIQLIVQFICESLLTVTLAFLLALVLVQLMLPLFNDVAGKKIEILWTNAWFWSAIVAFSLITGLLSGSYPAFYLSSFQPVKVLKGTFRPGRWASLPRKILVVFQFSVSITLMIGIAVVFLQIQFAQNRPVGYNRSGLVEINMKPDQLRNNFEGLRQDLLNTRVVAEMSVSHGSITSDQGGTTNVSWHGKAEGFYPLFMTNKVAHEFGKTVGWTIKAGRDFSREHVTDNDAVILNETAVKLIGYENPIDETLKFSGKEYKIIGVVQDLIKESPFRAVKPSFFMLDYNVINVLNIKLSPDFSTSDALTQVEAVLKKYYSASPFEFYFVDQNFAKKFSDEVRVGKLSGFFAILALFISCLGIFGLAAFMAEQRTKEIGIRKVLGASIPMLWKSLSKDFVVLVIISCFLSVPIGYYLMNNWLQNYEYRTEISGWIFLLTCIGALGITLATVSYQAIRAAMMNPVNSLRTE
jgi:ABC-type antimicrobial peptide transport system permease subunit